MPDGTAMSDRMIVEQDACDLLAEAAPEEPEKVQEVARFAKLGASVMAGAAGSATGEAIEPTAKAATKREPKCLDIARGGLSFLGQLSGEWSSPWQRSTDTTQFIDMP